MQKISSKTYVIHVVQSAERQIILIIIINIINKIYIKSVFEKNRFFKIMKIIAIFYVELYFLHNTILLVILNIKIFK